MVTQRSLEEHLGLRVLLLSLVPSWRKGPGSHLYVVTPPQVSFSKDSAHWHFKTKVSVWSRGEKGCRSLIRWLLWRALIKPREPHITNPAITYEFNLGQEKPNWKGRLIHSCQASTPSRSSGRTWYITCGTRCKIKMAGPLFKND